MYQLIGIKTHQGKKNPDKTWLHCFAINTQTGQIKELWIDTDNIDDECEPLNSDVTGPQYQITFDMNGRPVKMSAE